MYTLVLLVCMLAVVLSPLALDLFLSFKEASLERRDLRRSDKKKSPRLAWASSRLR